MTEEINVVVLNALQYETEKAKGTRLQLIPIDKEALIDNKSFKGFGIIDQFVSYSVFNELKNSDIMQKATLEFMRLPNQRNPLKTTIKPTALIINNVRTTL